MRPVFTFTALLLMLLAVLSSCGNTAPLELTTSVETQTPEPKRAEPAKVNETSAPTPVDDTPEPVDTLVSDYTSIIDCYRSYVHHEDTDVLYEDIINALTIHPDSEQNRLSPSCGELRFVNLESLEYSIHDINGDGIDELIILSEDYFIHSIFTLYDNVPVLLDAYWSRYRCVFDRTGTLYVNGSNGAADSYSIAYLIDPSTASLVMIEMIGTESFDEETLEHFDEARCYHIRDGVKTIISDEEARVVWEHFPDVNPDNPTRNAELVISNLS